MNVRQVSLQNWLSAELKITADQVAKHLVPLCGDASFRRYYRFIDPQHKQQTYILMDAPPEKETVQAFVTLANAFSELGVRVPEIIAQNLSEGFLLLTDFGDSLLLDVLNHSPSEAQEYYKPAIEQLLLLQQYQDKSLLGTFNRAFMQQEMQLFSDWYLVKHLNRQLQPSEQDLLLTTFSDIAKAVSEQPYVCVHRDFHSRNLMVLDNQQIGIIDFQDAVWGPISYDILSLYKDCYIAWPRDKICAWLDDYRQRAISEGIMPNTDQDTFIRWVDLTGIQRHLKVAGIFARLYYRDNKSAYLQDIPLTMTYLNKALAFFPEYQALADFIRQA